MTSTVPYRPIPGDIPTQPGVYRFLGPDRRVLYVGKAKNLRARLANYFAPLTSLQERTRRMVQTAVGVEWTVVGSEVEAFQLEITWINDFKPPFNVRFKDDKSYPYLVISMAEEAPRAYITRKRNIPGARYFGPYPKMWAVTETLETLVKIFPIRTCKDSDYRRAMQTGRPCFAGQIGKCFGPCSGKVTVFEHRANAEEFVGFMQNQDQRLLAELETQMQRASATHDYETAARRRDQLRAAEAFFERNAMVLSDRNDIDVFGIAHDELSAAVELFMVRNGRVSGVRSWAVDKELDVPLKALIDSILQNSYRDGVVPPARVVVPELPEDVEAVELWLTGLADRKVQLRTARRGDKAALLDTATQNARQALIRYKAHRTTDYAARTQALEDIQAALGIPEAPLRIECFDVSHLSGTNIVASMVVFEDGLARKNEYRKFSIAQATDDTDAIAQVISRRLAYLKPDTAGQDHKQDTAGESHSKFVYRPSLLVVDGGKPQVNAAARAMAASGIQNITLCGIAKRLEEIWLPEDDFPVILPRNSEALFLFQRMRDEAHRFAIAHQRQRRKRDISTILAEIPGLGPVRTKAVLGHFGSVARIRAATASEIAEVRGISTSLAAVIQAKLNEGNRNLAADTQR